jgi:glucan biosynthesis protein C
MLTSNRMVFFDNLRVVLIAMVIVHHVGQAYGPTGGWWPVQEPTRAAVLGPFFMVNRSFGMSLFFMIAGYFAALSCERSGPRVLVRSRLQRLGIPLLGFTLLMVILQVFVFGPIDSGDLGPVWPIDVVHFWFVQHLLLYSLGFALWQSLRRGAAQSGVTCPYLRRQRVRAVEPAPRGSTVRCNPDEPARISGCLGIHRWSSSCHRHRADLV